MARWLLYGAYGFTGRLIAREAVDRGLRPVVAGRNPGPTGELARELELDHRCFPLDDPAALREGVRGMDAVLHAAGPFSRTARPMVEACLDAGCHYLDITGEIGVFEWIFNQDSRAREAGVALLPGMGFDVVPTDCASARAAARLGTPAEVILSFWSSGGPSRGTARTVLERLGEPSKIRRDGEIVEVPQASMVRTIPFSDRERNAVCIPWGDVSTAWRSTGAPDVRVFMAMPRGRVRLLRLLIPLLRLGPVRRLAASWVERRVRGPAGRELEEGTSRVWCMVTGREGREEVVELVTPNGYTFTARAAVAGVARVLQGNMNERAGALTPSLALGADFVDDIQGVRWVTT